MEFFKPNMKKIILFLMPIIFLSIIYAVLNIIKSDEWKITQTPLDFIVFYFPCYIESNLLCKSDACCFESINTQVASSLIFYVSWFLFSFFLVWVNEKIELRGFLWRKLHEKIPSDEKKTKEKKSEKEVPKIVEELPVEERELIEQERLIKEEEEFIKQEKERLFKTMNELNIRKLKEMGLDVVENKVRCSICKDWKPLSKRKFQRKDLKVIVGNMIKKHGIDIIWTYKCNECKTKKKT